MPTSRRTSGNRKKAHKPTVNSENAGDTSSNSPSFSFNFPNPADAPTFPPSSTTSNGKPGPSSGRKSFKVPTSSEDEDSDSSSIISIRSFHDGVKSADSVPDESLSPAQRTELATQEKEAGNVYFKNAEYNNAIERYTRAIELDPINPSYLTNRAASFMGLKQYTKALADCLKAVDLQKKDPQPKTLLRLARCQIALGMISEATRTLDSLVPLDASRPVMQERQKAAKIKSTLDSIKRDLDKEDWNMVLLGVDAAAREVEQSPREWIIWKVAALIGKKRFDEAVSLAGDLLRANPQQPDALYYRGLALYHTGNIAQTITHLTEALRNDPDLAKARTLLRKVKSIEALKDAGNDFFKSGNMEQAIGKYTEALAIDPSNTALAATLLSNRATANQKVGKSAEALADCDACLEFQPSYWKAMRTRARVHLESEDWEAAIRDFKAALDLTTSGTKDSTSLKQELKDAELSLKKSKMKDHYKTLGIGKEATDDEIKRAYRKASLMHHPDKGGTEEKFKEIGEAYAILSNPERRRKFDMGIDENDPTSDYDGMGFNGGFRPFASNGMDFESMFGGGGYGRGFGGGGAGYYQF